MVPFGTGSIDKLRATTGDTFPDPGRDRIRRLDEIGSLDEAQNEMRYQIFFFGTCPILTTEKEVGKRFAPATWEVYSLDGELDAYRYYI